MFCTKCGRELPDSAAFCTSCGNRITTDEPGTTGISDSVSKDQPTIVQRKRTGLIIALSAVGALVLIGIVIGVFYFLKQNFGEQLVNTDLATPKITITPTAEPIATPDITESPEEMPKRTPRFVLPTQEPSQTENDVFSDDLLGYFSEVAFDSYDWVIKRWEQPVNVELSGDYTDEDLSNLVYHLEILNALGTLPAISIVDSGGNFFVYFVPKDDFDDIFTDYDAESTGYYNYTWNDSYQLVEFVMAAAADENTQEDRNHLVLEMLMRGLGLLGNSEDYPESVLHYDSAAETFADIDYYMLYMMYSSKILSGMDASSALASLSE